MSDFNNFNFLDQATEVTDDMMFGIETEKKEENTMANIVSGIGITSAEEDEVPSIENMSSIIAMLNQQNSAKLEEEQALHEKENEEREKELEELEARRRQALLEEKIKKEKEEKEKILEQERLAEEELEREKNNKFFSKLFNKNKSSNNDSKSQETQIESKESLVSSLELKEQEKETQIETEKNVDTNKPSQIEDNSDKEIKDIKDNNIYVSPKEDRINNSESLDLTETFIKNNFESEEEIANSQSLFIEEPEEIINTIEENPDIQSKEENKDFVSYDKSIEIPEDELNKEIEKSAINSLEGEKEQKIIEEPSEVINETNNTQKEELEKEQKIIEEPSEVINETNNTQKEELEKEQKEDKPEKVEKKAKKKKEIHKKERVKKEKPKFSLKELKEKVNSFLNKKVISIPNISLPKLEKKVKPEVKKEHQVKPNSEEAKWKYIATHDELTNLYNEKGLKENIGTYPREYTIVFCNTKSTDENVYKEISKLIIENFGEESYFINNKFISFIEGTNKKIDDLIVDLENTHSLCIYCEEGNKETALIETYKKGLTKFEKKIELYAKRKKNIPDYDDLLTMEQKSLKETIQENHEIVSDETFDRIILDIESKSHDIREIFLTSADFNTLFIFSDADEFLEIIETLGEQFDCTYIYAVHPGGALYYGTDEYFDEVTRLFQNIANELNRKGINQKVIQNINGINIFKHIYFQ